MQLYSKKLKRGAFGKPDVPFLQPEGRTYSPLTRKVSVVVLPMANVRSPRGCGFCISRFLFTQKETKNERT